MRKMSRNYIVLGAILLLISLPLFLPFVFGALFSWRLPAVIHSPDVVDNRPAQELVEKSISPDGLHNLLVYQNMNGHATTGFSATVFVSANESGKKWKSKDMWCLFFSYGYTSISAEWMDDETIRIYSTDEQKEKQYSLIMNIYQKEFDY